MFPACGTSRWLFFLSVPGSCWLCVTVSSTSSPFSQGPRWPCFATMSPRSPIYARWGGGGHPVSCSQHRCPGDPPLGGISSDSTGSAVHSGDPHCSCGLSLPSSPAPQFRMVSQHGHISIFAASVAGEDRPVGHFRQSPLLISLPSLATGFFGTCCVPFGSLLHPTRCVPLPGTSRGFCAS